MAQVHYGPAPEPAEPLTSLEHAREADRLLAESRRLYPKTGIHFASDRDRWDRRESNRMLAEAQVHAALASAPQSVVNVVTVQGQTGQTHGEHPSVDEAEVAALTDLLRAERSTLRFGGVGGVESFARSLIATGRLHIDVTEEGR